MTKKQGEGPFDLLLEEITRAGQKSFSVQTEPTVTQTGTSTSAGKLNFGNLLKSNNKRKNDRINTTGFVNVYDETGKPITRGVLRNVSPGGFGIESYNVQLKPQTKVIVDISGTGVVLGKFNCIVSWITPIEDHPENHKQIGFNIAGAGPEIKAKFEQFVSSLKVAKRK